jgi:hypothetical protein
MKTQATSRYEPNHRSQYHTAPVVPGKSTTHEESQQNIQNESVIDQWKKLLPGVSARHPERTTKASRPICLCKENSRTNSPWGDELVEKAPNHTRIYVINFNGLAIDRRGGKFDTVCKMLKEIQVDVLCGQV